jgi:hypothetical protein
MELLFATRMKKAGSGKLCLIEMKSGRNAESAADRVRLNEDFGIVKIVKE